MFRKVITLFIVLSVFLVITSINFSDYEFFDTSNLSNGTITVNYDVKEDIKTKLMLEKDNNKYYYDLTNSNQIFPLQLGNGDYIVTIFEQKEGNKYKLISTNTFELQLLDENAAYLSSNEIIMWNSNTEAAKLAKELTDGLTDNQDKVDVIYTYIVQNIKYDYNKASTLTATYLPNPDTTLKTKDAICYDFASLFAAMTRSIGIPTKLIKGYKSDIDAYHAWNQILINDNWVTIDTTYNSTLYTNSISSSMVMNPSDYDVEKIY